MATTILVVDDDPHIREVICFALEKAGMHVVVAEDGSQALTVMAAQTPDLIVLDIGMPEMDGLETCRRIRKTSEIPILFLSAHDEEIDRVLGLEIGGDDYVTKPFSPRELVARINVILKRLLPRQAEPSTGLMHGELALDLASHRATFHGVAISLTVLEFSILECFAARPNQVFTREQILASAYNGAINVSDRTIDSHIRNIRAKLAAAGGGACIETVHGIGFRLGSCKAS